MKAVPVILEHAILPVHPRQEANFEAAFEQARPLGRGPDVCADRW